MANIILPQVEMLSQRDDNTNILVEQNGTIQRLSAVNFANSDELEAWFATGKGLSENTDLNNLDLGKYHAQTNTIAKSIINKPAEVQTNFCVFNFKRTSNTLAQLLITLSGKMYVRSKSTTAWSGWISYSTSAEIEELIATVKQELTTELEPYIGFYTLAEGETIEDAPEWAKVVIDPNEEPPMVEMVATFVDGTTTTYHLYGEVAL